MEKWKLLSSIIYQINWNQKGRNYNSKLNTQRVDIAANYLISRREYQNPRCNFFIRKALPILTEKQKKFLEEELEEDDFMNSIKKSKKIDELINFQLSQNKQQKIYFNNDISKEIPDIQKQSNEFLNENNNQEFRKQH